MKAQNEKPQATSKGKPINITADFSMKTLKLRRAQSNVLQLLKDHRCQPRLLYPAKLSITIKGENKIFQDKSKFKHYLFTDPALQKILEGKLQPKEDNYI